MKLIVIPPYRGVNYTPMEGHFMVREPLANMRKKGQLEGVEVDIDDGEPVESTAEGRDAAVFANVAVGILKRVRMYCEGDRYDAIVFSGGDHCLSAARLISKIPVAGTLHSAVHVASLIGDRCTVLDPLDPKSLQTRQFVQNYGFTHKVVSARHVTHSTTNMAELLRKYKKEERSKIPEINKLVETLVIQCIEAIEEDRVDSIILDFPGLQCFEDETRQRLDKAGYAEIPLIIGLSAAVEMAKAMVNMKLMQAPRAYPSDGLKAKPKFR